MEKKSLDVLAAVDSLGGRFYTFMALLGVFLLWGVYSWWTQFVLGLQTTGLNNTVIWGLYISNFVFLIGISHAGILISATVRLLNLKAYRPITRMAEVLTLTGLVMAVLSVVTDLGRPDRVVQMFLTLRVGSPLAWDLIFISLYFTFSAFYLFISMRRDIVYYATKLNKGGWLYGLLIWVYGIITPKDEHRYERMLTIVALLILPFPVFGSGMVVPFIFSMLAARSPWNTPFFGPYFLTGAVVSGISAVVVIAAVLRVVFKWGDVVKDEIFTGLGRILKIIIPFYIYLTFVEQFTIQYTGLNAELAVSNSLLEGPYAALFWAMIVGGFVVPELMLLMKRTSTIKGILAASILVTVGLWVKRVIIVVPVLLYPNMPFDFGQYFPTWVEGSIIVGIFSLGILLYCVFLKLFPIIELDAIEG